MHLEQRVLISGGAGFLGSHLAEKLLERGYQVLCVDNFFTGTRRNIEHLLDHKHFELLRHDITHPLFVEVDQIFNLACPASPIHYQEGSGADHEDERHWRHQHAWAREAPEDQNPAGINQ